MSSNIIQTNQNQFIYNLKLSGGTLRKEMNSSNANNKNILIVDDDINTSTYKKWLEEEEGFNLTLINDPDLAEKNFNPEHYDLVLIGFRMSVMDGFDLYYK